MTQRRYSPVAAVLDSHPVGLVPIKWLAAIVDMPYQAVENYAQRRDVKTQLTRPQTLGFGARITSFAPWVDAWGAARVLDYLDQHDAEKAEFLRAGLDLVHDTEREDQRYREERAAASESYKAKWHASLDPAALRAKRDKWNAARYAARAVKVAAKRAERGETVAPPVASRDRRRGPRRHEGDMSHVPLGLLPNMTVGRQLSLRAETVARICRERSIGPYTNTSHSGFPYAPESFEKIIAAWGEDRSRAWLVEWAPGVVAQFERHLAPEPAERASSRSAPGPVSKRGGVWRDHASKQITAAIARRDAIQRDAAAMRRTSIEPAARDEREPAGQAETVAEFLARGGRVKKLVGAGHANVGQVAS